MMRKRQLPDCLCVVCGDLVPEGRQVCPICEDAARQAAFEAECLPDTEESAQTPALLEVADDDGK